MTNSINPDMRTANSHARVADQQLRQTRLMLVHALLASSAILAAAAAFLVSIP